MPFRTALSGLTAASAGLRTTANNIANAGTTGFKQSRAEFAEVLVTSASASGAAGSGARVSRIAQQFNQGNTRFTDNALDVAIGGDGFFVLSDAGSRLYTRSGAFGVSADGFVVNADGHRLQAYPVGSNGQFNTSAPTDLRLAPGRVTGVSIDESGVVVAHYSNGQSTQLGKIAVANFANPEGLQRTGGSVWAESAESGSAVIGEARTSSFGSIQSGALETSNVDLTEQLLKMIEYSRQFEAQAEVLRTAIENAATVTDTVSKR